LQRFKCHDRAKKSYFGLIALSFLVTIITIYYLLADWRGANNTESIGVQGERLGRRLTVRFVDVLLRTVPSLGHYILGKTEGPPYDDLVTGRRSSGYG
jgi:hypothetical protein